MKLFPRRLLLTAGLAMLLSPAISTAADAKKKPEVFSGATTSMLTDVCSGCHGQNGVSTGPSIPTIAGMSSVYFTEMMEGYKTGDIPSTIMDRMAKGYTTEEIEQMAEFYAKQDYVAVTGQKFDAALASKGEKLHDKYCEKCHSELGTLADDDSGFLQGQWKTYLAYQLADYTSDTRTATKKMKKKLVKLHEAEGDAGIKALIEFYSK